MRPTQLNLTYPGKDAGVFWSPILGRHDMILIAVFAVFIFSLRALLTRLVFLPIARAYGSPYFLVFLRSSSFFSFFFFFFSRDYEAKLARQTR